MGDLVELSNILGWALLPFIISVIYGCSHAGNKKIAWIMDVFVMGLGIAAFAVVKPIAFDMLTGHFDPAWDVDHWWMVAANLIGYLASTLTIMIAYVPLYAGAASAPTAANAH